tara:strand:+ start:2308 stop:2502 length:195 start_codon:yes stop_codon:yes gene_type:complete
MATKVIPLDTNEILNKDWEQYVIIDVNEKQVSSSCDLTTSLLDLEEGNIQENNDKYCIENCIIC